VRDAVRRFVETEIKPNLAALEHGDTPPYEVLRKFVATFGVRDMALAQFEAQLARDRAREAAGAPAPAPRDDADADAAEAPAARPPRGMDLALRTIPVIEISKYSPGMVTALGVSMGLTAGAITARGTVRQKERWARDLLTLDKIGAWAITEPGSGSD